MKTTIMALLGLIMFAALLPSPAFAADEIAHVTISLKAYEHDHNFVIMKSSGTCEKRELKLPDKTTTVIPCVWNKGVGTILITNYRTNALICEASLDRDDRWKTARGSQCSPQGGNPKGSFRIDVW
jgi:hypothetical protein